MIQRDTRKMVKVHYRIGSLEKTKHLDRMNFHVHYRIGSLETNIGSGVSQIAVHYRIGSLEMIVEV